MSVRLAVVGMGRMGQAILGQALKDKDVSVAAVVDRQAGAVFQGHAVTADLDAAVKAADVLIDFTGPEATLENAPKVARAGKAYVVGTTGLVEAKRDAFVKAVKGIPCVLSSNMSLSANVMFDVAERVARALPGYDNEVVEIHHNLKKDSPSGTAQTLAESVRKGKGSGAFVYGRHGIVGERKADEVGVHAVRGGDVVGDHTVFFLGAGERIELIHRVTSRDAFAGGAVAAAKWLVKNKKPAGLYDMRDVLGLRVKRTFLRFETREGSVHWGVLEGRRVEEILPDPFGPFASTGLDWALKDVRLLAPCVPSKIVCVGVNYADHAAEFGKALPEEPLIFLKPPSAVIAAGEAIRLPGALSKRVDYEGELAIVIGKKTRNVTAARAAGHILGYTIMNDVSARDLQKKDGQWARAKGFDSFAPLGPWIAAGISPADLKIETFQNGVRRQSSRTSRMVFKPAEIVAFTSRVMTLEPGDVISTGTPAGIGPMKKGDRVEVRIEQIGSLANPVR